MYGKHQFFNLLNLSVDQLEYLKALFPCRNRHHNGFTSSFLIHQVLFVEPNHHSPSLAGNFIAILCTDESPWQSGHRVCWVCWVIGSLGLLGLLGRWVVGSVGSSGLLGRWVYWVCWVCWVYWVCCSLLSEIDYFLPLAFDIETPKRNFQCALYCQFLLSQSWPGRTSNESLPILVLHLLDVFVKLPSIILTLSFALPANMPDFLYEGISCHAIPP